MYEAAIHISANMIMVNVQKKKCQKLHDEKEVVLNMEQEFSRRQNSLSLCCIVVMLQCLAWC